MEKKQNVKNNMHQHDNSNIHHIHENNSDIKNRIEHEKMKDIHHKVEHEDKIINKFHNRKENKMKNIKSNSNEKEDDINIETNISGKMKGMSALLKNAPMTPRKMSLAARLIRRQSVSKALDLLSFQRGKGARLLLKLLKSAIANANNINKLNINDLTVSDVNVGRGDSFKRFMPRAKGNINTIVKQRTNITIILSTNVVNINNNDNIEDKKNDQIDNIVKEEIVKTKNTIKNKKNNDKINKEEK